MGGPTQAPIGPSPSPEEQAELAIRREESEQQFRAELERVINRHSMENRSGTPDFILANYLLASLRAYDAALVARSAWYGG